MLDLKINFDDDKTLPMIDVDEDTASVVGHDMRSLNLTFSSDWTEEKQKEKLSASMCKDCGRPMNIQA